MDDNRCPMCNSELDAEAVVKTQDKALSSKHGNYDSWTVTVCDGCFDVDMPHHPSHWTNQDRGK